MRKLLLVILCFLFFLAGLKAQNRTVTGKVTDSKGAALSNISVVVKGTNIGTTTDLEGAFSLSVPDNRTTLVFSSVGTAAKEVDIRNLNIVSVSLLANDKSLQEVVVTALGITRDKRSLGYATQTVKGAEIANKGELNMLNALQGRLAGVNITGASGGAGASTNINIRGTHSFTGNNQPLFIVDGIPISNNVDRTNGGPLGSIGDYQPPNRALDIDPNNIESINVLKGGAAAALYGSRAANGVIVITTKKGSGAKGRTDISLNSSYSIQKAYGLIENQNVYGQGTNGIYSAITGNSWGPKIGATPTVANGLIVNGQPIPYVNYPNNVQDFFEKGSVFDNNLTINSGDANQNFTFSIGNSKQIGIVPNTEFNRTTPPWCQYNNQGKTESRRCR